MSKATHSAKDKSDGNLLDNTADIPAPKMDLESLAVKATVKPLTGKKPQGQGNTAGKVRLKNTLTGQIITGFIPVNLAQMQANQNSHIEIVNDEEKG